PSNAATAFLHVGSAPTITLELTAPPGCDGGSATTMGARVSVLDPDNMPAAFTLGAVRTESGSHRASVTLTPSLPGPYHFTAVFDPNLGTAQLDVDSALDQRL